MFTRTHRHIYVHRDASRNYLHAHTEKPARITKIKKQKVDHHLQGGIHNNNPRELTQVSDQSPRVDKPNNAKLTTSHKPPGCRYEIHPGRQDRQTEGRTEGRLQRCNTVSGNARSFPFPAEPSPESCDRPAGPSATAARGESGETPGRRGGWGRGGGERGGNVVRSRRPPPPVQSVGPPESGLRGGVERKGIKYGERPP